MSDLPIVEPWSEEYAKWYPLIHRGHNMFDVARAVVEVVIRHVGTPSSLLDLGAGNGEQTGLIARGFGMSHEHVCCYEPSKGMSDIGRQKYPGMKWLADRPTERDTVYGHFPLVTALFNVMHYAGVFPFEVSSDLQNYGGLFVFDTLNAESILREGPSKLTWNAAKGDLWACVEMTPTLQDMNLILDYVIRIEENGITVSHFRTIHRVVLLTLHHVLVEADRHGYAVLEILKWGDSRVYVLRKEYHGPKTEI